MAANVTIAKRSEAFGSPYVWEGGRKKIFITATGSTTVEADTGAYTVVDMAKPQQCILPGFSVAFSGTALTATSEIPLGNAVVHGVIYSTPGDL